MGLITVRRADGVDQEGERVAPWLATARRHDQLSLTRHGGHPRVWGKPQDGSLHAEIATPYPEAFRTEAVERVRTSTTSIPTIARELGVSGETLRRWVRRAEAAAGWGRPGELTTAERAERARRRRDVKTLPMERDILNKAAACFHGPPDQVAKATR